MGVLRAVNFAPYLLSLPVGVLVDRTRRRPLLIGADLLRALSRGSIPLAAVLGVLAMPQLYVLYVIRRTAGGRLAWERRRRVERLVFVRLTAALTGVQRAQLDALLVERPGARLSWHKPHWVLRPRTVYAWTLEEFQGRAGAGGSTGGSPLLSSVVSPPPLPPDERRAVDLRDVLG